MESLRSIASRHLGRQRRRARPPTGCRTLRRHATRDRGVSLVELVLLVGIVAILASLAATTYSAYRDRVDNDRAAGDVAVISISITEFRDDYKRLPTSLAEIGRDTMRDPWGHAYEYVNHATAAPGQFRKDKNIVPINTDFDLSSYGKDGASAAALTAEMSRDDIIRANDGGFIGRASVYDP
jgi:general secretion pathway protein G